MNLLVCYTPLHALIAMRLVELGAIGNFRLLYLCFNDAPSHHAYYARLSRHATHGSDLLQLPHDFRDPWRLALWGRSVRRGGVPFTLICGNLKHAHSRFLAWVFGIRRFETFDDGSGNIVENGYFSESRESRAGRCLFAVLGRRYLYVNVVRDIERHYSIYAERNVYEDHARELVRFDLMSGLTEGGTAFRSKAAAEVRGETATVYIGHTLTEDGLRSPADAERIDRAVHANYAVDYFLPHPRSRIISHYEPLREKRVKTSLIAEEFVIGLRQRHAHVRVIGLNSTALLNLSSLAGIDAINLRVLDDQAAVSMTRVMKKRSVSSVTESDLMRDYETRRA
ncbi:glycosyltransferase family 52 [Burkholderia sp. AW49-1]